MYLTDEFRRLTSLVDKNITFVRYGDGEVMLTEGIEVPGYTQAGQVDKWTSPAGISKLGQDLGSLIENPDWYYGIPCQCCNDALKHKILQRLHGVPKDHITFANMFVNAAYPLFQEWIKSLKRPVVLAVNEVGRDADYPFVVLDKMLLPNNCVYEWQDRSEILIQQAKSLATRHDNTIFLISAGPLKVLIKYMYEANPSNTYLDVGSSLDPYTHRRNTRPYQASEMGGSGFSGLNCYF